MINENSFSPLNVPSVTFTSSATTSGFNINPTSTQVKNAAIGIITLLLIKSNESRMDMFRNVICPQIPNPSDEGIPIINAIIVIKIHANLRLQLNLSLKMDTIVSIKEIDEVSAAKNTNIKNAVPTKLPIGMLLNTFGNVTNINPGPVLNFLLCLLRKQIHQE